jgi:hypothetical protein
MTKWQHRTAATRYSSGQMPRWVTVWPFILALTGARLVVAATFIHGRSGLARTCAGLGQTSARVIKGSIEAPVHGQISAGRAMTLIVGSSPIGLRLPVTLRAPVKWSSSKRAVIAGHRLFHETSVHPTSGPLA